MAELVDGLVIEAGYIPSLTIAEEYYVATGLYQANFSNSTKNSAETLTATINQFLYNRAAGDPVPELEEGSYKFHVVDLITLESVYGGYITVAPNPDHWVDPRTENEKILEAAQLLLQGRTNDPRTDVAINGRSISFASFEELTKLVAKYTAAVHRERLTKEYGNGGLRLIELEFEE